MIQMNSSTNTLPSKEKANNDEALAASHSWCRSQFLYRNAAVEKSEQADETLGGGGVRV